MALVRSPPNATPAHVKPAWRCRSTILRIGPLACLTTAKSRPRGGKRVRFIDTPHTPARGPGRDLRGVDPEPAVRRPLHPARQRPALTESALSGRRSQVRACSLFHLNPEMGTTIRALAELSPRTLALMHGPSLRRRRSGAEGGADDYDRRISSLARGRTAQAQPEPFRQCLGPLVAVPKNTGPNRRCGAPIAPACATGSCRAWCAAETNGGKAISVSLVGEEHRSRPWPAAAGLSAPPSCGRRKRPSRNTAGRQRALQRRECLAH